MQAVRLEQPGTLRIHDVAEPTPPGPGQVLVALSRLGICGTDLHAFHGRQPFFDYPRILGHELAVEILALGEGVEGLRPGQRATVIPYLHCGRCLPCRRGRTNCCADIRVLGIHIDGGMQERFVLPAETLLTHDTLSADALALVETLAIGAHAVARSGATAEDRALVVGAGPIGLGVGVRLRALGTPVLLLDRSTSRLEAARSFGLAEQVVGGDGDAQAIADWFQGEGPTLVFDATGNPASMNRAVDLAAPSATVVFVGLHQGQVEFTDTTFHKKELTLMASRNARREEFAIVLDDLAAGRVDPAPWITHRTSLSKVVDDLPAFTDPTAGVVKAMLDVGQ